MNHRRLLTAFGSLLGVAGLSGCANSLTEGLTENLCAGRTPRLLQDLAPSTPVDYVALREAYSRSESFTLSEEAGVSCAETSPECASALEEAPQGMRPGFYPELVTTHLVTTKGDEVKFLVDLEQVREFLGEIDTPSEAALLAYLSHEYADLSCDEPQVGEDPEGYVVYLLSGSTCGEDLYGNRILVRTDGTSEVLERSVVQEGDDNCSIGRLHPGLRRDGCRAARGSELGHFYAEVARLEAASVAAFEQLARELESHGAPRALVDKARAAAWEEARHALWTGVIAQKNGVPRVAPRIEPTPLRDLEAIALDNAVEGLVRETFGALLAHHQALHAEDPLVRAVARRIADDETNHAAFSLELHAWLLTRLEPAAQRRVQAEFAGARLRFSESLCAERSEELARRAGLPDRQESRRLFAGLGAALWDQLAPDFA